MTFATQSIPFRKSEYPVAIYIFENPRASFSVIRQIKRCLFRQIKTGLLWCLIMV